MMGTERIIVLVDMDCFYCQVEEKLNPDLKGKPMAVLQYNQWRGGGLIAVNYEARARGVTRHMRGDDAKKACPDIQLVSVPTVREKSDLTRYRRAGTEVAAVLQSFTSDLERASVDEAYLDITSIVNDRIATFSGITPNMLSNTHVVGFDSVDEYLEDIKIDECLNESNVKLFIGGQIVEEMRAAVFERTGYRCSAGVAHNKILAKLCAGLHKPNQQTILPHESVDKFYETISVKKIRSMGGKFGDNVMQKLHVETMSDLVKFTEKDLQHHFDEKTAKWLYYLARGINNEPVTQRLTSKTIGCCKKFPGKGALTTDEAVRHWIHELSLEIVERIETDMAENNRKPKQLVVSYSQQINRKQITNSRSQPLTAITHERLISEAHEIVKNNCQMKNGGYRITFLGLNVGKFEDVKSTFEITSFFKTAPKDSSVQQPANKDDDDNKTDKKTSSPNSKIESDDSQAELEAINSSVSNTPKSSFFQKFLIQTPKRDFDTSINLEERTQIEETNEHITDTENSPKTHLNSNLLNISKPVITDDNKELCTHCNKLIAVDEIASHLDYHYAISIVKDEAHLFKVDKNPTADSSLKSSKSSKNRVVEKCRKRKSSDCKNNSIRDFFKKDTLCSLDETNSEVCGECKKRIKLDELASHFDYHVAKRIHLEINPPSQIDVSTLNSTKNINKISSKQRKSKPNNGRKEQSNVTSLKSFFKPL